MKEQEIPLHIIFLNIYQFFVKKAILIGVFTLIGVGIGVYFHINKTKTFTSSAIAYSPVVSNQRLVEVLNKLEKLRKTGDPKYLSEELGISAEEVLQIREFNADIVRDLEFLYDKEENPRYESNCVSITVKSTNAELFEKLNSRITEFVNRNEYIKQKTDLRIEGFEKIIEKYEEEISEIDSLQKLKLKRMGEGGSKDFFEMNLSNAETQSLILKRQLENSKEQFAFVKPLVFVQKLSPVPFSDAIIYKPVAVFGFVFFVLGIFVVLIQHFNALLKKAED